MLKPNIKSFPKNPGVYIFKNQKNDIIYIGKAKNLRNRISQYFYQKHEKSPKTQFLVKNISNIDYIIVNNEVESLLLENKLIKKHKPKYNINLKDSKTYPYIKITNDKIPKIISTRTVTANGDYYGPYTDAKLRTELIKLVVEIFQLITKRTFTSKSSLYYDIGISPAKTLREIDHKEYLKNVQKAKEFLSGKTGFILNKLKTEMKKASESLKFELANKKKKQIESIKIIKQKQKVDLLKSYDQDVLAIIFNDKQTKSLIQLFNISKGVINSKKEFRFDYYDVELLENFIKVYYSKNSVPKEIIVNLEFWENIEDKKNLEEYFKNFRKSKVDLIYPKRGDKKSLIEIAIKNAKENFKKSDILDQIKKNLKLEKRPSIIECFDMSNLGSDYLVGAMTRFIEMQPDKTGYRKFEIKSFRGKNDDFASIREVIYRRYKRLQKEKLEFPDLIIIDGGRGQLNSALESLRQLNLRIPLISLAKQDEEIYVLNKANPYKFDKNSPMMLFIRDVRDKTHDFVINYNRKKRQMKFKKDIK